MSNHEFHCTESNIWWINIFYCIVVNYNILILIRKSLGKELIFSKNVIIKTIAMPQDLCNEREWEREKGKLLKSYDRIEKSLSTKLVPYVIPLEIIIFYTM